MSLVDIDRREAVVMEDGFEKAIQLGVSRDELRKYLKNPQPTENGLSKHMATYLNAIQAFRFENGEDVRYATINDVGMAIKTEVEYLLEFSVECAADVTARVEAYNADETAMTLKAQGISPFQRAFTMTMLDMIDGYRPAAFKVQS